MSSFASLGIGASALYASQRAVEVAAHNVANASTPGFTRQRLAVQTSMPTQGTPTLRGDGQRGTGVTVMSIDRLRDRLADVAYRTEAGTDGAASATAETLRRAESVLGPYAQGSPEALSRFVASWDELSLNPSDPAARSSVLAAGAQLADGIRASATGLDAVAAEVALRVQDQVGELNGLLEHVAGLNRAIKDAVVTAQSPNDLYDRRDLALDRIASLTGARVVPGDGSDLDVQLGDRHLVRGQVAVRVVATGDELPSLEVDGGPVLASGQLGGHIATVGGRLVEYRAQLDALAAALRDTVNGVHAEGLDLDGSPGGPFFTGEGALDLRIDTELTERRLAASSTGSAHDGNNAVRMAALRTTRLEDGRTLAESLRAFGGRVGQDVTDATRTASTAALGVHAATQTRAGVNGVNVDEEMVDLVKFQHQYSAASRVITIVDEMLDRIINRMGA